MPLNLGTHKIEWGYDPTKKATHCILLDKNDTYLLEVLGHLHYDSKYNKIKARAVTFNKLLKKAIKMNILDYQEFTELKRRFKKVPNSGVI